MFSKLVIQAHHDIAEKGEREDGSWTKVFGLAPVNKWIESMTIIIGAKSIGKDVKKSKWEHH